MTGEQKSFIEDVAPIIQKYAPQFGIKVCSPIIAQAILESTWGGSKLSARYHNYFGLKCGSKWTGKSVNMTTQEEYKAGVKTTIKDNFRVYDSMEDGVKGYFVFLQLERYHNLRGITDPRKYLETIKRDGYATSSTYVPELMKVIETYGLTKYDKGVNDMTMFKSEADAIDAMISTADAEAGYVEKKSNAKLDSKTANAGSKNYTKYWRDVKPSFQGESWCACFVTWVFMVVFGQEMAEKLLKHFPFTYCPTLAGMTSNKTPKRGSIILFWRSSKNRYGHTGIVYKVDSTYVYTIEGNTSGASGVVANGGGVCKKKYKLSSLDSRTKYFVPDYSIVVSDSKPVLANIKELVGNCVVTLKTFSLGASDAQIKTVQTLLNVKGYKGKNGKPLTVDGRLGDNTAYAVAAFQKAEKLDIKSPGTIGGKTWVALINSL